MWRNLKRFGKWNAMLTQGHVRALRFLGCFFSSSLLRAEAASQWCCRFPYTLTSESLVGRGSSHGLWGRSCWGRDTCVQDPGDEPMQGRKAGRMEGSWDGQTSYEMMVAIWPCFSSLGQLFLSSYLCCCCCCFSPWNRHVFFFLGSVLGKSGKPWDKQKIIWVSIWSFSSLGHFLVRLC